MIKNFLLNRKTDESGVSGTGYVAEGTQFSNGRVVLVWRNTDDWTWSKDSLPASYADIEQVEKIHGHGGKTKIEWLD